MDPLTDNEPAAEVFDALHRLGLLATDGEPACRRMTGGVSSDIWKIERPEGAICIKQALAKLRVEQDWFAPVERNAAEVAWIETANRLVPGAAPDILAHDPALGLFAMPFLAPEQYPLWKTQLLDGVAEVETARAVADRLVRIHAGTAGDGDIAARFANDETFHAIRLEPYLEATARAHPDLQEPLQDLVVTTAHNKKALVHGDVSPKNILIGPTGPVFLDAECAWYGDPAFDLAFCLNHLLLKCLWRPRSARAYLACFDAMVLRYLNGVNWEPARDFESRAARLLPGLLLARVDGKSPLEYITTDSDKDTVRRTARALLERPGASLHSVRAAWARELKS